MFPKMIPRSPLLLLLLGLMGCSGLLGLDDLSFEEGSDAQTGGASSGGRANEPLGTGGEIEVASGTSETYVEPDELPSVIDDFPSEWPSDARFAVEPGGTAETYYFAYEPTEHRLSTFRLSVGPDLVDEHEWATDLEWSHFLALNSSQGPVVIGYDQETGILERVSNFDSSEPLAIVRSAGNIHSHLLYVSGQAGDNRLFGYDSSTGFYRAIPATTADTGQVLQGEIATGWSDVIVVTYESAQTVLFCDRVSGRFSVYGLPTEGAEIELLFEGQGTQSRSLFSLPSTFESQLAGYSSADGSADSWTLASGMGMGGQPGVLEPDDVDTWFLRRDLSWIEAVMVESQLAIFSFDGQVLDARFPLADGGDPILR
jgi:hypothetical protein